MLLILLLLFLLLFLLLLLLKGKEKAPGEGKEMRAVGSSYIPLSAPLPFAAFKSHIYTTCFEGTPYMVQIIQRETPILLSLFVRFEDCVLCGFHRGAAERTCERYIMWSVVMPSTPVCWYNYSHYVLALYRHHDYLACFVPINTNKVNCFELCAYPCKDPHLY